MYRHPMKPAFSIRETYLEEEIARQAKIIDRMTEEIRSTTLYSAEEQRRKELDQITIRNLSEGNILLRREVRRLNDNWEFDFNRKHVELCKANKALTEALDTERSYTTHLESLLRHFMVGDNSRDTSENTVE